MSTAIRATLVEEEKRTIVASDEMENVREEIEVRPLSDRKKKNRIKKYMIFGAISSLIIIAVILVIVWMMR